MENKVLNCWILGVPKITPQTHMNSVQNPVSSLAAHGLGVTPTEVSITPLSVR